MATDYSQFRLQNIFDRPRRRKSVFEPVEDNSPFASPGMSVFGDDPPELNSGDLGVSKLKHETTRPLEEWQRMMKELYEPQTQDTNRFRQLLTDFPERNKPSWARKLVAGGLGVDARAKGDPIETMEKALYAPYLRDVGEWKEKTEPFYNAANLERQENIQQRTLLSNAIQAQTQAEAIASRERIADEKNRIAAERAEAYGIAQRAKAAGWKIDTKGPRILAISPTEGTKDLGPNDLSERQKIDLEGQWDEKAAAARGAAEIQQIRAAGQNLWQFPDGSIWELRTNPDGSTQWLPSKGAGSGPGRQITDAPPSPPRPSTPAQIQGEKQERYNKYYAEHPEHRKYFVPPDRQGNVRLRTRSTVTDTSWMPWTTESDRAAEKEYDAFYEALEGVAPAPTGQQQNQVPPSGGRAVPPAPGGGALPPPPPAGRGAAPATQKTVTRKQYSPSRNQTRITYSDGTTETVSGRR